MKKFKHNTIVLLFLLSSIVVLFISVFVGNMMVKSGEMLEVSTKKQLVALAEAAAALTTAEELNVFDKEGSTKSKKYVQLKKEMASFSEFNGVTWTYFVKVHPQNGYQQSYVIDNGFGDDSSDNDDSLYPSEENAFRAYNGVPSAANLGEYSDDYEGLLTAWSPVYYGNGKKSDYIVGIDVSDKSIVETKNDNVTLTVILIVGMVLVLISGLFGLILYQREARRSTIANRAKSAFLSRMSHELRTPMNAIIGLCRMATETDDIDKIKGYISTIDISSQHLRHVVDDILEVSKIESGKMSIEHIPVDMRKEIDEIRQLMEPQMEQKKQTFIVDVDPDVPKAIYFDKTHVRQVVVNLLSNAVKFTPEEGKIKLKVDLLDHKEDRCKIRWQVIDNGIGIKKSQIDKLFIPFEQGDISNTRKFGGTGLGLSISKQLVELMGGDISVISEQGKGSAFIFSLWLDVADEDELIEVDSAVKVPALNLKGKNILLVEDSDINQLVAENAFNRFGANVDIASDGGEGLEKYIENSDKYDIIFMDIQMPVMDGYQTTRKIRNSKTPKAQSIPIVAMTANVFKEDVDRAIAAGMNDHVGKPFEISQIEKVLREQL